MYDNSLDSKRMDGIDADNEIPTTIIMTKREIKDEDNKIDAETTIIMTNRTTKDDDIKKENETTIIMANRTLKESEIKIEPDLYQDMK